MTASRAHDGAGRRVGVCIPTLNPGRWVDRLVNGISRQTLRPDTILVIDSSSTDGSLERFDAIDARIVRIAREEFDHGGTRNMGLDLTDADVVVYLTQDAIPVDEKAFATLVAALLEHDRNGVAYGRQLPRPGDHPRVRAHRGFNYPEAAARRTAADVRRLGVRAAFSSNSFAAYRREALEDIDRFPSPIIGSEDRWAAARLLQRGWNVVYEPEARVEHSHDYRVLDDFRRYFDIGVFQAGEPWFEEWLGRPDREGMHLVRRQAAALREEGVPFATVRTAGRAGVSWLGFRLGRAHARLPRSLSRRCSMNPAFWARDPAPRSTTDTELGG